MSLQQDIVPGLSVDTWTPDQVTGAGLGVLDYIWCCLFSLRTHFCRLTSEELILDPALMQFVSRYESGSQTSTN